MTKITRAATIMLVALPAFVSSERQSYVLFTSKSTRAYRYASLILLSGVHSADNNYKYNDLNLILGNIKSGSNTEILRKKKNTEFIFHLTYRINKNKLYCLCSISELKEHLLFDLKDSLKTEHVRHDSGCSEMSSYLVKKEFMGNDSLYTYKIYYPRLGDAPRIASITFNNLFEIQKFVYNNVGLIKVRNEPDSVIYFRQ